MPSKTEEKLGKQFRFYKVAELKRGVWADVLPALSAEEHQSLKEAIRGDGGVLTPILLDEDERTILEGHHRLRVCEELGFDEIPGRLCSRIDDKLAFSVRMNLARRNLTQEQKREVIATLLRDNAARSDRTGTSFVGTVGEGDAVDFTAVGDTVNTAARLMSAAGTGEIVISAATAAAAEIDTTGLEQRTLDVRGRQQPVDAWVESLSRASEPAGV